MNRKLLPSPDSARRSRGGRATPIVSIIIPCYDMQDFLAEAIKSAIEQTYPAEIIVIDDSSTDRSLEIARSFAKMDNFKIITSDKNNGLPATRNLGIRAASGKYILPLDADDTLEPTAVEKMLRLAEKTNADVVYTHIHYFGTEDKVIKLPKDFTLDELKKNNIVSVCSLIKKEALEEVGCYDADMRYGCEDWLLWLKMKSRGKKFVLLDNIVFNHRRKNNGMGHNAATVWYDASYKMLREKMRQYGIAPATPTFKHYLRKLRNLFR